MTTRLSDPLEERFRLVEGLWDTIAAEEKNPPMTEAQLKVLDERLDHFELDIDSGELAEVVLVRIRQTL